MLVFQGCLGDLGEYHMNYTEKNRGRERRTGMGKVWTRAAVK